MDYCDFKKHIIQYRQVYTCLYSYVSELMRDCMRAYARYNSMMRAGVEEWRSIRQFGVFLYQYAELQNLTTGYITEPQQTDNYDWTMVENGLSILGSYQTDKLNDTEMMSITAQWLRKWYPFIATQRHFCDAMQDFRLHVKEITHKNGDI